MNEAEVTPVSKRRAPGRLRMTYDAEAGAAYVHLTDPGTRGAALARTEWAQRHEVILDLDREGRILGIEILGADRLLREETIAMAEP